MFTLNGDVVTVTTPSDCRWLQVELQLFKRLGEEEEPKKVKVLATGNTVSYIFCSSFYVFVCIVL